MKIFQPSEYNFTAFCEQLKQMIKIILSRFTKHRRNDLQVIYDIFGDKDQWKMLF